MGLNPLLDAEVLIGCLTLPLAFAEVKRKRRMKSLVKLHSGEIPFFAQVDESKLSFPVRQ
jgi:hypothetical protein